MAISKIGSRALEDASVATADIAPGSIGSTQLAGSIANAKLANSTITINGTSIALGASGTIPNLAWQSKVTSDGSTVTTMVAGRGYFVDNSSAVGLVKLPASASAGDTIAIKDYAGNFGTNKITIQRNGHKIQGTAADATLTTNRAAVFLVYIDSTKGWLFTMESNVAGLTAQYVAASGGTESTSGDFKIHSFTGDGNFIVSNAGNAAGSNSVEYLVVAGGGSGGKSRGGGGGAGGFRTNVPSPSSAGFSVSATTYPITVGAGASGIATGPNNIQPGPTSGRNGSTSTFSTISSAGGGAGSSNTPAQAGADGGSGGGGSGQSGGLGGSGNTPPVSPPQGNDGGEGTNPSNPVGGGDGEFGAGGGGHTAAGNPGAVPAPTRGDGGAGTANTITGSSVTYAGGGGGGGNYNQSGVFGAGGAGGGGNGGAVPGPGAGSPAATAGTANTGGGGGGSGGTSPNCQPVGATGAGGKGIVILRYKYQN